MKVVYVEFVVVVTFINSSILFSLFYKYFVCLDSELTNETTLSQSTNTSQVEDLEPTGPPKKFKRRNQALYTTNDEN